MLDPGNGWREGSGLPKTVNHRQKRQVLPVIVTGQRQALHKNVTSVPAEAAARCRWLWDTPDFRCVNTKEHSRCGGRPASSPPTTRRLPLRKTLTASITGEAKGPPPWAAGTRRPGRGQRRGPRAPCSIGTAQRATVRVRPSFSSEKRTCM